MWNPIHHGGTRFKFLTQQSSDVKLNCLPLCLVISETFRELTNIRLEETSDPEYLVYYISTKYSMSVDFASFKVLSMECIHVPELLKHRSCLMQTVQFSVEEHDSTTPTWVMEADGS